MGYRGACKEKSKNFSNWIEVKNLNHLSVFQLTGMWFFSKNTDFSRFKSQNGHSWDQCRPSTDCWFPPTSANHFPVTLPYHHLSIFICILHNEFCLKVKTITRFLWRILRMPTLITEDYGFNWKILWILMERSQSTLPCIVWWVLGV